MRQITLIPSIVIIILLLMLKNSLNHINSYNYFVMSKVGERRIYQNSYYTNKK